MKVNDTPLIDLGEILKMKLLEVPIVACEDENGRVLKKITVGIHLNGGIGQSFKFYLYNEHGSVLRGAESYRLLAEMYNGIRVPEKSKVTEIPPGTFGEEITDRV